MKDNKLGVIIKGLFAPIFYRLEWKDDLDPWGNPKFVFYPRRIPILIGSIMLIPIIVLLAVVSAIKDIITQPNKVKDWTSYRIEKGEKRNWFNAYKKL